MGVVLSLVSAYLVAAPDPAQAQLGNLTTPRQADDVPSFRGSPGVPTAAFVRDGFAYLLVDDQPGATRTLWRTDGTEAGSAPVLGRVTRVLAHDDDDVFVQRDVAGDNLWWTNGEPFGSGDHRPLARVDATAEGDFLDGGRILVSSRFNGQRVVVADRTGAVTLSRDGAEAVRSAQLVYWLENGSAFASDGTQQGTRELVLPPGDPLQLVATERFAVLLLLNEGSREVWRSTGEVFEEVGDAVPQPPIDGLLQAAGDRVFWLAGEIRDLWELRDADAVPTRRTAFAHPLSFRQPFSGSPTPLEETGFTRTASGIYFQNLDEVGDGTLWFLGDEEAAPQPLTFVCRGCTQGFVDLLVTGDSMLFVTLESGDLWIARQPEAAAERIAGCDSSCGNAVPGLGWLLPTGFGPTELFVVDPRTGDKTPLVDLGFREPPIPLSATFLEPDTLILPVDSGLGWPLLVVETSTGASGLLESWTAEQAPQRLIPGGSDDLSFLLADGAFRGRLATADAETLTATGIAPYPDSCEPGNQILRIGGHVLCSGSQVLQAVDAETGRVQTLLQGRDVGQLTSVGEGRALFTTARFVGGAFRYALFGTDGTKAGTAELASGVTPVVLLAGGSSDAYFGRIDPASERLDSVLVSDGTPPGTAVLADSLPEISVNSFFSSAALTDRWLYLVSGLVDQPAVRIERSTGAVQTFPPSHPLSGEIFLAVAEADTLFFLDGSLFGGGGQQRLYSLRDDQAGAALIASGWTGFSVGLSDRLVRLDGRTVIEVDSGLAVVTDAGAVEHFPLDLTHPVVRFAGRGFFAAATPDRGVELMSIGADGQPPRLVHDLHPGPPSSNAAQLVAVGDALYFTADDGLHGPEVWAITREQVDSTAACRATGFSLCLNGGRFKVDVAWEDFQGGEGRGRSRPVTDDTGSFWFFDDANLESMVKVLDGTSLTGHYWTYFGSLTNVAFALTVTDSGTGLSRRYLNGTGSFASLGDTLSLEDVARSVRTLPPSGGGPIRVERSAGVAGEPCRADGLHLCLQDDRFEVSVRWRDFSDNEGVGTAVALESDTGSFWFFDDANLELVIKVLDGTQVNGHFWVFYGSLSNVAFELTVRDTWSGSVRTYGNVLGGFASMGDVTAFAAPGDP